MIHTLLRDPTVVLIAAPDPEVLTLMREAVRTAYPSVTVQIATDGRQAHRLMATFLPDWLVVDLNFVDSLRAELVPDPAGKSRVKVVVIAGHSQDDRILPALRLGVAGFVMKRDPQELIATQLRDLNRGGPALTQTLAGQILRELDWNGLGVTLSDEQLELLTWLYAGDTPDEAATRMNIDVNAVTQAMTEIWSKTVYPRSSPSTTTVNA